MKTEEALIYSREASEAVRKCAASLLELETVVPPGVTSGILIGLDYIHRAIEIMQKELDAAE